MLSRYDELIGQCRSINDINRVHIAFGNTITPSEAVLLAEHLFIPSHHAVPALRTDRKFTEDELRRLGRDWIDEQMSDLRLIRKADPEPYLRRDIRKSVSLFTDGGAADRKTLLITLPGSNHRLMMPLPTFLQNLAAETTDVLIVRDGTRTDYTRGLDGLATSVAELGEGIAGLVEFEKYERVVGLGISAGGLPMILVAVQLDIDVLACGAGSPFDGRWDGVAIPPPTAFAAAVSAGFGRRVVAAFGAQSEKDRTNADEIARLLPVEKVEVAIERLEIEHNILHPMSERRMLPGFFREHLGLRI